MENKDFIQNYLSEAREVTEAISVADIDRAVEVLFEGWRDGNQGFTRGNGGFASTATHFARDLTKTTATPGKRGFKGA